MSGFTGLAFLHLAEIPTRFGKFAAGRKVVGLIQFLLGIWLMYLSYGIMLNMALGCYWWA